MEDIESVHAFETAVDIGGGIPFGMADVETRAARIGEHIQHIEFFLCAVFFGFEGLVFTPVFLPFLFDGGKIVFSVFHIYHDPFVLFSSLILRQSLTMIRLHPSRVLA